jgi:NAD(P)-dependent dehydrogenase (short-subunit alcohol dehydrogenase family)
MERKTVIVTGGSRGIGAAISKRFARESLTHQLFRLYSKDF